MKATCVLLVLVLVTALPVSAQSRRPERERQPADTVAVRDSTRDIVATVHPLLYTGLGVVNDPGSQSQWIFADAALGGGGAVHIEASDVLWLGLEGAFARTNYERRAQGSRTALAAGRAGVGTVHLNARVSSASLGRIGGLGGRGMGGLGALLGLGGLGYISLGTGTITWLLDDLAANTDLEFHLGGGLEYSWSSGRTAFLEYRQLWSFHEREGVDESTARHSRLDIGARAPLRR